MGLKLCLFCFVGHQVPNVENHWSIFLDTPCSKVGGGRHLDPHRQNNVSRKQKPKFVIYRALKKR